MKSVVLAIGLFVWAGTTPLQAQRGSGDERGNFEEIISELLPVQEEDVNYSDLYDRLFSLYSNRLDLNTADREELESLYLLSDDQIGQLLEYRRKYGPFLSEYELLSVPGFDRPLVDRLLLLAEVGPPDGADGRFKGKIPPPAQHDLLIRTGRTLEPSGGFTDPDPGRRFNGGPWHMMMRYTIARRGSYSLGFTIEQDPGEKIAWKPRERRYGMDYYSLHAMIENRGIIKRFVLGDYALEFGQGLLFGSGFRTGKGTGAVRGIRRNSRGIKPYRSVFEHRDFSGAALTLSADHFSLTCFGSYVFRDANVYTDSSYNADPYVTYIKNTGLHRNRAELEARHSINEKSGGFNFQFATRNETVIAGVNGVKTVYSRALIPEPKKYNRFAFAGAENTAGSIYTRINLKQVSFFGEAGMSESGGRGMVGGLLAGLSSYAEFSLVYRNYDRNFHTFYGNAFGEDYRNSNEEGLYIGLTVKPVRQLVFNFFYDRFRFPYLRYRADGPSTGYEAMAMAAYTPGNHWSFRLLYRVKKKELNGKEDDAPVHRLEPALKQWARLDVEWKPPGLFSARTRVMTGTYDFCSERSAGFLLAQDLSLSGSVFFARGRIAYFNTEDYDTRQFIYEHDVLYVYSVPFFYGIGWRYYLVAGVHAGRRWTFWMKLSQTRYADRLSVGSGLDEIPGNVKTGFRIQARLKF